MIPNYTSRNRSKKLIIRITFVIIFVFLALMIKTENKPEKIKQDIGTKVSAISTVDVYNHKKNCIQQMDMDEYLVCVVAAEMPASFHIEALKAQAVSARTYTIYKSKNSGCFTCDGKADVCTNSACCQAYIDIEGMKENWGDDFEENYAKIKQAVYETRGEVIVYSGDVIEVFYHASAGGMTEDSGKVFSTQRPYLVSVTSEGEQNSSNYYSKESYNYDEFIKRLKKLKSSIEMQEKDIEESCFAITRTDSGRVSTLTVCGESFCGTKIRKIFDLNSTNFSISLKDGEVVFDCVGFGHGVGMSQNGANVMAKQGCCYIDILKHYFSGVEIVHDY